ncbi:MAG: BamA/TamA family outer membrane protein [Verrucomicrobia bacterium]|nr:BamA/TamA family outer membrane protein [Verrucomicrobiota bacterium]
MHPRPKILFLIATVCAAGLLALHAQPPVAPPEPTPLPGISTPPPAAPVSRVPQRPAPPLPTPREIPAAPAPEEQPAPEPQAPAAVEPYQPALPLNEPVPKPPVLTRVRVVLEGNTHFSADQIRAALADPLSAMEQSGLTPALADDAAFLLGVFYRKNGYSQVEVKWAISAGNTLRLTIVEGPFTRLGEVVFRGNAHLPASTLLGYVTGAIRERFPDKKQPLPYVESDVKGGVERIRGLYHSEGFLDATVDPPVITISPDKTRADVAVTIHEGIQYHFGKITFEGDIIFYPQRDLLKEMEVFTSKPYTPLALTNLERKIDYFYRTRGYFTVEVSSESDPAQAVNGYVPVKFIVRAGEVYRFDGVTQSGLGKLRPNFLPNRFKALKGEVYNPELLEDLYRKLIGTGLFTNLKLTQIPLPSHEVELHFDVEEAKARELGFSVGYAKLEGLILGTHYVDRNLFGNGRPLNLDAEIAQKLLRGEVLYTDPWFLETENTLRARLFALSQELDGYSKTETGLRPEFSRKFGKNLEISTFLLTRYVEIANHGIDPAEVGPIHYRADSLGLSATYDKRDSVLNPRRGFVINTTGDFATNILGSSLQFLRGTFRASYYHPVGTESLLAAGVRGGVIAPLGSSDDLPIDERFFNGGSRTVRSFNERTLGPKDSHGFPGGIHHADPRQPRFGVLRGCRFHRAPPGFGPGADRVCSWPRAALSAAHRPHPARLRLEPGAPPRPAHRGHPLQLWVRVLIWDQERGR